MPAPADELLQLLEEFLRRVLGMAEEDAADILVELDLSLSQARAVFHLSHVGEAVPISEVARRLGLSQASAGRTVDQLVRLGLVDRRESTTDRRVKLVRLSLRGRRLADRHIAQKRKALRAILDRLPADDSRRLADALRPVLATDHLTPSTKEPVAHGNG